MLIYVWALEQEHEREKVKTVGRSAGDYMVPWKLQVRNMEGKEKEYLRYYHLFSQGELEAHVMEACKEALIETSGFERDNWYLIVAKAS